MKKEYTIYHIPGIKIGCSDRVKKRVLEQGYSEYDILETHTNIHIASDRELVLQKEYGYRVDLVRYDAVNYSKGGKIVGDKHAASGHMKRIQTIGAKLGGDKQAACGQTRNMGLANIGKKRSEETKLKMSIAQQNRRLKN